MYKLKKNISQLENSLDKIQKIRGVNYNWIEEKDDTKKQIGFIAQEIEDTFPELVETNKDNKLLAETINIIPMRDIKTTSGNSGLFNDLSFLTFK